MSQKITNKEEINNTLRAYMLNLSAQRLPFIISIFSREHRPGGIIYEGVRPLSCSVKPGEDPVYTLTNGDSDYSRPIASLSLGKIEYIEV